MDRANLIEQKVEIRRQLELAQQKLAAYQLEQSGGSAQDFESNQMVDTTILGWLSGLLDKQKQKWGKQARRERLNNKRIRQLEVQIDQLTAKEYQLRNAIDRSRHT
ncbi:MAG: hypothetical protein AAF702_08275 [Chloroflexota bacterium]